MTTADALLEELVARALVASIPHPSYGDWHEVSVRVPAEGQEDAWRAALDTDPEPLAALVGRRVRAAAHAQGMEARWGDVRLDVRPFEDKAGGWHVDATLRRVVPSVTRGTLRRCPDGIWRPL